MSHSVRNVVTVSDPPIVISAVLAILVPILYTLGRVFGDGYWQQLGVGIRPMDLDVSAYLYAGFLALLFGAIDHIGAPGRCWPPKASVRSAPNGRAPAPAFLAANHTPAQRDG